MRINPNIFKAYDIRGKFPAEVNEKIAELVGNATAQFLCQKSRKKQVKILVCRDVRVSSKQIKDSLIKGVINQGSEIVDIGIGTTPFFNFLVSTLKPDGGIMLTASHNPPDFAGFKIRGAGGKPISLGAGLEKIRKIVIARKYSQTQHLGKVNLAPEESLRLKYLDFLSRGISIGKLQAVIDAGGGSASLFLPQLLAKFPDLIYKPLFFEPDGTFQRHPPNPLLKEAQQFIQKELARGIFQFGAIFDGDGDRVVFFDEQGNPVRAEYIFALFAAEALKKEKGLSFVVPINSSKAVREYIEENGGKIKISRVGYTFIRGAMQKNKAPLGVEMSGHFYFKKLFFNDSGLETWLRLAGLLSKTMRPLSQLVKPFERYVSSGEKNFPVKDKKTLLARVKKFYREGKISLLDGVTFEFPDWWFNLRPSNTEEIIRLVVEAKNKELFEEKLKELEGLIKNR